MIKIIIRSVKSSNTFTFLSISAPLESGKHIVFPSGGMIVRVYAQLWPIPMLPFILYKLRPPE